MKKFITNNIDMKREINFRGKRTDNGEWVYGGYGILGEDTDLEKSIIIVSTLHTNSYVDSFYFTDIEVSKETIGQFTGLKDKNGVEIYEGDIFHLGYKNMIYTVVWHDTGLRGQQNGTLSFVGLNHCKEHIEKVGNIHDNPEMLEQ